MYIALATNSNYSLKPLKFLSETTDLPHRSVYHFKLEKPYLLAGNLPISM